MRTNKSGISLIVLVLTIVIMIVLAGVIITNLSNSGIISRGKSAVSKTNLKQIQELATVAWGEAIIDDVDATTEELEAAIRAKLLTNGMKQEELNKYWFEVTTNNVIVTELADTVNGVPIPKGFTASRDTYEDEVDEGLVIYEGTAAVTSENVETAKRTRNQYVWVPVPRNEFDTKFVRKDWDDDNSVVDTEGNYYALGTTDKYWEVTPDLELTTANLQYMTKETLDEVQKMYASVEKYGGFYVARYEAGLDEKNIRGNSTTGIVKTLSNVHSKMNKIPYNYIGFSNSDTMNVEEGGAVEVARSLYPETNTSYGVVSTLMYGVQWDRTLSWWLEAEAKDIDGNVISIMSTKYGNYTSNEIAYDTFNDGAKYTITNISYIKVTATKDGSTSWLLTTGATEETRVNNIYDMAGNVNERTMEGHSASSYINRGGWYNASANNIVSDRSYGNAPGYMGIYVGFRVALYIK